MKKLLSILFVAIILTSSLSLPALAEGKPKISSDNALLVDMQTGKSLYDNNSEEKIAPGGFVKIMTAIIAIEAMVDPGETVVADAETIAAYDYSFGHMGILAGEILTLDNLINGMLIYDAGDAAEVIAKYTTGSREDFIKKMNNKAVEIGALNTKFTNPTGFPDKKQYSTLEDISKITRYAMELDYFKDVVSKHRYEINPTNKYREKRYLDNKNKFLSSTTTDAYYTIRAKGIKTSYINDNNCGVILLYQTDKISLLTLISGGKYDGITNYAYEDTRKLINYGLDFYTSIKAVSEGEILAEVDLTNGKDVDRILLEATDDIYVNLPKNYDEKLLKTDVVLEKNIKAPLTKGKVLGKVTIYYDDEEYVSCPLTSPIEVEANNFKGFFTKVWTFITSPVLLVSLGILLIIIVWSTLIFNRKKTYKITKKK